MKSRASRLVAVLLYGLAVCATALADVIPPGVAQARQRFERHPRAFDRVDPYCDRLSPGDACAMPGTRFEGGGPGRCERQLSGNRIDLACSADITWRPELPPGPYRAPPFYCRDVPDRNTARSEIEVKSGGRFVCRDVPAVHDRACAGLQPGDACEVVDQVRGQVEQSEGRCTKDTEVVSVDGSPIRFAGASRPVVLCKPVRPVQRTWRELNLLEKLLQ